MASTSNVEFSIDAMMSKVSQSALGGSAIRKMFTLGQELRDKFGEDNVFDFSIGNPALEPPKEFQEALLAAVNDKTPMNHGYTANQGLLECRAAGKFFFCAVVYIFQWQLLLPRCKALLSMLTTFSLNVALLVL